MDQQTYQLQYPHHYHHASPASNSASSQNPAGPWRLLAPTGLLGSHVTTGRLACHHHHLLGPLGPLAPLLLVLLLCLLGGVYLTIPAALFLRIFCASHPIPKASMSGKFS